MSKKKTVKKTTKKRVVLKLKKKMVFNVILMSLLFIGSIFLFVFASNIEVDESRKILTSTEKSNISYQVNLVRNGFYQTPSLGMDQQYPQSLTNDIIINYEYLLNYTDVVKYTYNYYVAATIVINNKNTSVNSKDLLLEKSYQLEKPISSNSSNSRLKINKSYRIDYKTYNSFVNQYKNTLGLNVDSYLKVIFHINVDGKYSNEYIYNNKDIEVDIPLVKNPYEITINNPKDQEQNIIDNDVRITRSKMFTTIASIMFLISILLFVQEVRKVISSDESQSKYISKLNKIISSNSEVIVKVKNKVNLKGHNVMEVESIEKLLDVQNELRIPIAYYEEERNNKGYFVIVNGTEAWEYILKVEEDS